MLRKNARNCQHICLSLNKNRRIALWPNLTLNCHTVIYLKVVQNIGRYTTTHVITSLVNNPQSQMMLRTNVGGCQQSSLSLSQNPRKVLFITWWANRKFGYGLVWRENRARWFGLTIHQQSLQIERCTAHGEQISQVTRKTRIVLTWSSILEGGMTTSASIPTSQLPLFFAKRRLCSVDIAIKECIELRSHCDSFTLLIL